MPSREGFLTMRYRICNLSNVRIRLCRPGGDPSPRRIPLDSRGEGVFDPGLEGPNAAEAMAAAPVMMRGRRANRRDRHDAAEGAGVVRLTRAAIGPGA